MGIRGGEASPLERRPFVPSGCIIQWRASPATLRAALSPPQTRKTGRRGGEMAVHRFSPSLSMVLIPRTHPTVGKFRAKKRTEQRVRKRLLDIYAGYFKEAANSPSTSDSSANSFAGRQVSRAGVVPSSILNVFSAVILSMIVTCRY